MNSAIARGKLLRISSADRALGQDNGDFTVSLGNASYVQNVRGIILKQVSFKHVFPNVYEEKDVVGTGNTTFSFNYNGVVEDAIIPAGWYSANDYAVALENVINALPAVVNPITVTLPLTPLGSTSSRKFKFEASGGDLIGLITKDDGNAAADLIGIAVTDVVLLAEQVADWLPDFGGLSTLYLCSGTLAGYNCSASSSGGEQIPVISPIPMSVAYGEEVYYETPQSSLTSIIYNNDRNFNSVDISLCTRNGNKLSLQQNFLTCTFKIIHSSEFPSD